MRAQGTGTWHRRLHPNKLSWLLHVAAVGGGASPTLASQHPGAANYGQLEVQTLFTAMPRMPTGRLRAVTIRQRTEIPYS